jgi:cell division protein FtsI/penicillin-binding protein 2
VFKTVTVAAALEKIPDIDSRTWDCKGSVVINGETITCAGTHGTETLSQALANSCNVAFAEIADELGADTLEAYTKKAGLMDRYSVDGIPTARGTFDFSNLAANDLGWAGVGQFRDQVNPCSLMVYMGAIAGGGKAAVPYLIEKTVGPLGVKTSLHVTRRTGTLIESATAAKVADMMANNVKVTYGTDRFPNMDLCAKSGTAEVGSGKSPHAWFAGFLRSEKTPYAFVVLVENGGGGASVAGTVAGKVLNVIVNGYKK